MDQRSSKRRYYFIRDQRKRIPTLYELSKETVKDYLATSLDERGHLVLDIGAFRKHIRKATLPLIREQLLAELLPYDNHWEFACLASKKRQNCKFHPTCQLAYNHCSRLLKFLFSSDMQCLKLNLKKVSVNNLDETIGTLLRIFKTAKNCRLSELYLPGGSVQLDEYLPQIADMCFYLGEKALKLVKLHLPIASNSCLKNLSKLPALEYLKIDRSKHLNCQGLQYLCHEEAATKHGLKLFHLGVFKHHQFNKVHVAHFLAKMTSLVSFSLLDDQRALISNEDPSQNGAKVMTYSALKLAIIQSAFKEQNEHDFVTALTHLNVVDRSLNPDYVLQACPNLKSLTLDWQEEWSQAPFQVFQASWFSTMIHQPDWKQLLGNLSTLKITFPAAYNESGYNLPYEDFSTLMHGIGNLSSLSLKGMKNHGQDGHFSILDFLHFGTNLIELTLDSCSIFFPHPGGIPIHFQPNEKLKKFHLVNKNSSFVVSNYMLLCISRLILGLHELVLRPENPPQILGFTLNQIRHLASMTLLNRLEIPVSMENCINNMPEFIYVLRDFPKLKYLKVSWANNPPEINGSGRSMTMLHWLENALRADNANIHVQICHELHSNIYSNPPSSD